MVRLFPVSEIVIVAAGQSMRLKRAKTFVRQLVLQAGPKADGTPNTGVIYVGGDPKANAGESYPLAAGISIRYEAHAGEEVLDLGDFFVMGASAGDVVRMHYLRREDQ